MRGQEKKGPEGVLGWEGTWDRGSPVPGQYDKLGISLEMGAAPVPRPTDFLEYTNLLFI